MFQHVRGPNCSKPTPKKTLITGVWQRFLVEVCVKYFCWATGGAAVIDAVGGERDVSLKWLHVHVSMRQEVLCLHLFDVQSSAFLLLFFFSDDLSSSVSAAPHLLSQPPPPHHHHHHQPPTRYCSGFMWQVSDSQVLLLQSPVYSFGANSSELQPRFRLQTTLDLPDLRLNNHFSSLIILF